MIATSSAKLVDVAGTIKDFVKSGIKKTIMVAGDKVGQAFARVFGPCFGASQNAATYSASPSVAPGPSLGMGATGPPAARRKPADADKK